MAINGDHRDSTGGGGSSGGERRPPSNLSSSSRSTPSAKNKEGERGANGEGKPGTPSGSSKPTTPNGQMAGPQPNGKPPTPGMPGYPPGFPLRPGGPGAAGGDGLPLGYPYQNGVPPGLPGAFPPRPPLVRIYLLFFMDIKSKFGAYDKKIVYFLLAAWSRSTIAWSLTT